MILNILLYVAIFLNCVVIGRIVSTDCSISDLVYCCKIALFAVSLDTVLLVGFALVSLN